MIVLRQINEFATSQRDSSGQSCALGADWVLSNLHEEPLSLSDHLLNRAILTIFLSSPFNIEYVQEGRALKPDVDEGRLHPGQHPKHLTDINVADKSATGGAFDMKILQHSVDKNRYACFAGRTIDQNILYLLHGSLRRPTDQTIWLPLSKITSFNGFAILPEHIQAFLGMESFTVFACRLFTLRTQRLFALFLTLSAGRAASARAMPLRLKRDVFKAEFRQKHFLSVGKHLFPINAFLDTQVRHNGPMTRCQRPDMQVMHAAYAGNATQCIPHVVIVDALGNSSRRTAEESLSNS